MNDPNAEHLSSRQKGIVKSINEMLNKKHKLILFKDPRAREAVMYVAAAACILGMIAIGALALKSHSTDEGFSQLYFDNPDSLPNVIFVGKGINFSFSLASYEKKPFTYKFNVKLDGSSVKTGVIRLNPQEKKNINVTLMPKTSSLVHIKTAKVAQFRGELNDSNIPVQLNASWIPENPMTFIPSGPNSLKIRSLNDSETEIMDSPNPVETGNSDNKSSFGHILRKGQYSTSEENGQRYLDYEFSGIEYRYRFRNISVSVSGQNEPLNGDSDTHIIADAQHRYEIHFRAITAEDMPEKFLNNISG